MDEYQPYLRLCEVLRPAKGSCGFHLCRTQWDPYPWVSGVDPGSAAEKAGLRPGDCVLEVNGEDVLGERIGSVAGRVRARKDRVTLLLWNAGSDPHASISVCGGTPTPLSLQRLSACLQSVLQLLECPVCLDAVPPPAYQCCNGHVLCAPCRSRTDKCPVCRVPMGQRGRCLLADKLHNLLSATFKSPHYTSESKAAAVPPPQRLVQLKSRLLLQSKASSEENVSSPESEAQALRVRSLSTGQIPSNSPSSPSPGPDKEAGGLQVHCPRGAACQALLPAQRLLQHLQESHEGPWVQYFPRTCASMKLRLPEPGAETVSVTTADGHVMFVQVASVDSPTSGLELRLVWFSLLGDDPAAQRQRVRVTLAKSEAVMGPVFSLTTSWDEIVASNRCLVIEDHNADVMVEILDCEAVKP